MTPARPIRIVILGKNATRGGTMRLNSYLLKFLDHDRIQPMMLLPDGGDLLDEYRQYAPTHVYKQAVPNRRKSLFERALTHPVVPQLVRDMFDGPAARRAAQRQRCWLLDLLREFQPHLILRTYHEPIALFDGIDALTVPQVQQFTLSGANLSCMVPPAELARIFARSSCFICEGVGVRDELHRCWGVPLERIRIACLGIDLSSRDGQLSRRDRPRRPDLQLSDDSLVVGAMGAWYYGKGVDIWVEAAARLRARYPDRKLKFLWIGLRPYERRAVYGQSILNLIEEHGLQNDIIVTGDQREVYPYLDMCDIYVQPSRDDAFPHATLEAMAVAKPVVAFPQGVALEDYARNALIRVEVVSPDALADGIGRLIEDPSLREGLGQAGLQLVYQRFDLLESVRRYEQILVQAVFNGKPVTSRAA